MYIYKFYVVDETSSIKVSPTMIMEEFFFRSIEKTGKGVRKLLEGFISVKISYNIFCALNKISVGSNPP